MPTRPGVVPERDTLPDGAVPVDAEREGTPLPPPQAATGRSTRISTVLEIVNVPAAWLDRLISLGDELPFDRGEEFMLVELVTEIERLVPGLRAVVRPPPRPTPRPSSVSSAPSGAPSSSIPAVGGAVGSGGSSRARHVQWTEPPKSNERLRVARAFPDALHERSVPLSCAGADGDGSLHFAADENLFTSEASPHAQFMDRAAIVVSQALVRVRTVERTAALETALRTSNAQMVQAEKLASLGQIAAGMVHELNNPLTSIAAYTDFLLRRAAARPTMDPDDVERIRRIAESANRMLRFTRDLVSYARPSGDIPIAVHLNVVIDRALAFCEHEIAGVGASVERAFDADVGPVRGLPEQLAQVFVNLVTNACHAMARPTDAAEAEAPSKPAILTITTGPGGDDPADRGRMTVVVQDTGCGISQANLALVFQPFFTTKAAGRGTGLGLSIVKNIVEAHGGRIRAESDPSTGTRFVLTFPIE